MGGSTGHVVAGFLASVVSAFLHLALSDGRSVVVTRAESEEAIAAALGPKYGVGVFHDARGFRWGEEEHGVYACDEKRRLGKTAVAFALVALVANAGLVLVHLVGAQRGGRVLGLVGVAGHAVSAVALSVVLGAATALYDREYCGSAVKEHFQLSYGVGFVVAGIVVAAASAGALVALGALKGAEEGPAGEASEEEEEAPANVGKSEPFADAASPAAGAPTGDEE